MDFHGRPLGTMSGCRIIRHYFLGWNTGLRSSVVIIANILVTNYSQLRVPSVWSERLSCHLRDFQIWDLAIAVLSLEDYFCSLTISM